MVSNVAVGNYGAAAVDLAGLAADAAATIIPGVPGGAGYAIKAGRAGAKLADNAKDAKKVTKIVKESAGKVKEKTYQTYTKKNSKTGEIYTGRTSGTKNPRDNVKSRDANHHKKPEDGWEPAVLDKTSSNKNAIRGREQQLIDKHGGAKSTKGSSGNDINGISSKNKNAKKYIKAANKEFGKIK
jgi:hypothetical protein